MLKRQKSQHHRIPWHKKSVVFVRWYQMDPSHASWIASSSGVVGFPPSRTNGNVCSSHLEGESNFKQQLCIQITFGTVISHSFMGYLTNKRSDHYANHHSWNFFPPPKKHLQNPFEEPYHFGIRKPSKTWRLTAVERRKDMPILCKHTGPQPVMDQKAKRIQKATPCVIPYCPYVTKFLRISEKGKLQINFKKSWCP